MALSGYVLECAGANCPGGISNLWLIEAADIDQAVGDRNTGFALDTTGIYDDVALQLGAVWANYGFQDYTGEFRQNSAINANGCGSTVTQEIEITFPCSTVEVRNVIEEIKASACCGLVAIVEKFDGSRWVVGYLDKQRVKFLSSTEASGKALSDSQATVLILQCIAIENAYEYTGTITV